MLTLSETRKEHIMLSLEESLLSNGLLKAITLVAQMQSFIVQVNQKNSVYQMYEMYSFLDSLRMELTEVALRPDDDATSDE
jgi:hypothetical protein